MILQQDPRLEVRPTIKPYGCYFMCMCFAANKYAGTLMGIDEIVGYYDKLTDAGAMSDKCYIHDARVCMRILGLPVKVAKKPPGYVIRGSQFAIELWTLYRQETGGWWRHFVIGTYDPWGLSETRRYGKPDSVRVFTYQE